MWYSFVEYMSGRCILDYVSSVIQRIEEMTEVLINNSPTFSKNDMQAVIEPMNINWTLLIIRKIQVKAKAQARISHSVRDYIASMHKSLDVCNVT